MTVSYAISVQGLGDGFEAVRAEASRQAKKDNCWFWWMPEADDWHRFVFTDVVAAIMFGGYLRKDIVNQDDSRIRRQWVSRDEIRLFAEHCVYIRSVFEYYFRIFAEGSEAEYAAMETVAPRFFEDLALVFNESAILAACRVTEPWIDKFGNENFTVDYFTNILGYGRFELLHARLVVLQASMEEHRGRIKDARDKLTVHADLETITWGEPIAGATWPQWHQFWKDLGEFVSLVHENAEGSPFEIRAAMVRGDAEMVLKKMQS
jgi:AbiU2